MTVDKLKPGDVIATTNIVGYEGKEVAVFLGFEMGYQLLYIQWLRGPVEKIFKDDFEKSWYKTKLEGIADEKLLFKRKKLSTKRG